MMIKAQRSFNNYVKIIGERAPFALPLVPLTPQRLIGQLARVCTYTWPQTHERRTTRGSSWEGHVEIILTYETTLHPKKTIEEICELKLAEVMKVKNVGRKSAPQLLAIFEKYRATRGLR
jgi:hypothetical protein